MAPLSRVVFETADGVDRLLVLCAGCLLEIQAKTARANLRCRVRDFGAGSGMCEFCEHEISRAAGQGI